MLPPDVQAKVAELNKAIFRQEADRAAELYQTVLRHDQDFVLREPVQFDLARLLEAGHQDELALAAFQLLIKFQPTHVSLAAALKSAGTLAFKLKRYELCMDHFERLIEVGATKSDRVEIDDMLSRLPPDTRRRAIKLASNDRIEVPNFTPLPVVDSKIELPGLRVATPAPEKKKKDSGPQNISMEWKVQKTPTPPSRNRQDRASVEANTLPPPLDIWSEAKPLEELEKTPPQKRRSKEQLRPTEDVLVGSDLPPTPPIRPGVGVTPPPQAPPQGQPAYYPPYIPPPGYMITPPAGFYAPPPGYMITPMPGQFPGQPMPPGYYPHPGQVPPQQPFPPQPQAAAPPMAPPPPAPPAPLISAKEEHSAPASKPDNKKFPPPHAKKVSKRYSPPEHETPEARYHRLRDAQFALILPLNKRIHLESVAEFIAKREQIEPSVANKKVLRKKGLLYDELTLQEVLEIAPLVKECRQSLVFVSVPRQLRPYEHYEVVSAETRDQGLKLNLANTAKRIRWDDISLINCGRIGNDMFVTILGSEPMKEYRFSVKSFEFSSLLPTSAGEESPVLHEFVDMLSKRAPDAVLSHTAQTLLKEGTGIPQPFGNADEFHSYTLWMLFSHRAEIIDAGELLQLSQITSNW
ncbi:tetratricopeptide repeat protein [Candidatus Sumerlaeota bacterium]|nr:tetratricopeptide repeat protein [Candidatus Sumerlaeota bacterium]